MDDKNSVKLYSQVYNISNLLLSWRKARKHKTKKPYVIEFEKNTIENLFQLQKELIEEIYFPKPLITFILRDPKTRKISKSAFRDRIIHHALVRIIEPIFDKSFIYDSCANRKGKGNLFAIKRFDKFKRKVTNNLHSGSFCLKADIRHYFEEVDHEILLGIIKRKISDEKVIMLIEKILNNLPQRQIGGGGQSKFGQKRGMPLGNLTSQFFANIYLNELDYFVKHKLKVKYYIRYVDDFVILHSSEEQLEIWKEQINYFLNEKLKLELHPDKSKIIPLSRGIDFVGFRNFYHYRLLRKRNIKNIQRKIRGLNENKISYENFIQSFQGWQAYAKWSNCHNLINNLIKGLI
jgi:retron-type reverse transcriptase